MKLLNLLKLNRTYFIQPSIKEIHNSFYSEVDKLIVFAKQANSLETDKQFL